MNINITNGNIPIKDGESKLRFVFAGDLYPHKKIAENIISGKTKEIIADIEDFLLNKDLSMVNFEAPITDSEYRILKSGPNLKAEHGTESFLVESGFDIIGLSNNHIRDFGSEPVLETIKILEDKGLKTVGAGKNLEESKKPLVVKKNGLTVTILAISENEFGNATEDLPGGAPIDPISNINQIERISKNSDITIIFIHGGTEYLPIPNTRIIQLYRAYARAGASAVIAMHTHCPQGIEIYNNTPILYSLGNFLFPTVHDIVYAKDNFWWKSFIAAIEFDIKGEALSIDILPHTFGPDESKISTYDKNESKDFFKYMQFISDLIQNKEEQYKIWRAWCANKGQSFVNFCKNAKYPIETGDTPEFRNMLAIRNLYTCEAHYDLCKTFFKMVKEGTVEDALKYYNKIELMQKGRVYNIE